MAKTITLSETEIQSIVISQLRDTEGAKSGFSCFITYFAVDDSGNRALAADSQKFTSDSEFTDKLSSDSDKLVMDFVNAIKTNMDAREEL